MRSVMIIAGIVLLCGGAFLLARGGTFTSRRDVLKVGDVSVTSKEERPVPRWVGVVVVVAGAALVVAGARRSS